MCCLVWDHTGTSLRLIGAENCVNSISKTSDGHVLTGSWDGVARQWTDGFVTAEYKGEHEHAVEVLGLANDRVVTGSSNGKLVIYQSLDILKIVHGAHSHAVRCIISHPLGFATAGNDNCVRVWTADGDLLAETNLASDTENFLYGLCYLPQTEELVVCGENGLVKVLNSQLQTIQSIAHPGSVRGVCALGNGDIVTVCADRSARVFTRTPERTAPKEELDAFEQLSQMAAVQGMAAMDPSTLPGVEALSKPGAKDGAIKVVNVEGRGAIVYQWKQAETTWEELGEAVGRSNKQKLNGKEYDFVTDIFITPEVSRKLGFNKDDEAERVAADFCNINGLTPDFRDQIIAHVQPLLDPRARAHRLERERKEQESKFRHVPAWLSGGYEIYGVGKYAAMVKAITTTQTRLTQESSPLALSPTELKAFTGEIMPTVVNSSAYASAAFSLEHAQVMYKLLEWQGKAVLPVLDVFRLLMCIPAASAVFGPALDTEASTLLATLGNHMRASKTHRSLGFKTLSNWLAKRRRTAQERSGDISTALLTSCLSVLGPEIIGDAQGVAQLPSNGALPVVMFMYNVVMFLGRIGLPELRTCPGLYPRICAVCVQVATTHLTDTKLLFYSVLTLASVLLISPPLRQEIGSSVSTDMAVVLQTVPTLGHQALVEVCQDLGNVLIGKRQ